MLQCLAPSYMGSFKAQGAQLRSQGLNRIGNMLVPNSNYCAFEDWLMPILDTLLAEQSRGQHWTPSKVHNLSRVPTCEQAVMHGDLHGVYADCCSHAADGQCVGSKGLPLTRNMSCAAHTPAWQGDQP